MFRTCVECLHKSAISELFGAWLGGVQPHRSLWSSSVLLRSRKSAGKAGSSSSSSDSDSDSDRPDPGAGVDSKLREAAESVARSVPPSRSRGLQGDLLQQLQLLQSVSRLAQEQAAGATPQSAANSSKAATKLSNLLGQMQVQRPRGRQPDEESGQTRPRGGRPNFRRQMSGTDREKVKLFEGPALGIFTSGKAARTAEHKDAVAESRPSLWDAVSQEQLEQLRRQPPSNAFEEMIQWTQEGKMWTYPINNEQGLEEESQVGFHQHVFLEDQIADFPRRGPLRHFMELVVVGLAKNPHLSVQQKHQHIDWFRNYFREKEDVLREALGDDGVMAQSQQ